MLANAMANRCRAEEQQIIDLASESLKTAKGRKTCYLAKDRFFLLRLPYLYQITSIKLPLSKQCDSFVQNHLRIQDHIKSNEAFDMANDPGLRQRFGHPAFAYPERDGVAQ